MEMDKEIGAGRYGTVFKTTDRKTGKRYALKHIKMEGETQGFPVTAIREIKILKALDHENIIRLEEVITYGNEQPDEKDGGELQHSQGSDMDLSQFLKGSVFMVFEYVEFDLSGLILTMNGLPPDVVKSYMKQLLSGMFYMHRQRILHRDLKTANILITRGNVLKIADWGLARSVFTNMQRLTNKVVTLWYRSPELILETKRYGAEIDMWSAGCIFGELVCGQPILPGRVEQDQLEKIYQLCGTPVAESEVETRLQQCEGWSKMKFETTYPSSLQQRFSKTTLGHSGIDLIEKLLCMHPENRISAMDALDHEYFWEKQGTLAPGALPPLKLEDIHEAEVTKKRQQKAEEAKAKSMKAKGAGLPVSKYRLKSGGNSTSTNPNRNRRPLQGQQRPSGSGGGGRGAGGVDSGAIKRSHSERVLPPPPPGPPSHMPKSSSAFTLSSTDASSTNITNTTSTGSLPLKPPPFPSSKRQKES
jgi:cyclin-dependent kinase 12/13